MDVLNLLFKEQTLSLHPHKAIYWNELQTLLIADLHLGKIEHFRKKGFAVPQVAAQENWDKLIGLFLHYQPQKVVFLGDLFHSDYNAAWEDFNRLVSTFSHISFTLVQGNHDILDAKLYQHSKISVITEYLLPPFLLTHEPLKNEHQTYYNLSGHIHPCVMLEGLGHQRLKLPCFYFGQHQAILPAFGTFTGLATLSPRTQDKVYVIIEDKVLQAK